MPHCNDAILGDFFPLSEFVGISCCLDGPFCFGMLVKFLGLDVV